jgi:hypothetical protein
MGVEKSFWKALMLVQCAVEEQGLILEPHVAQELTFEELPAGVVAAAEQYAEVLPADVAALAELYAGVLPADVAAEVQFLVLPADADPVQSFVSELPEVSVVRASEEQSVVAQIVLLPDVDHWPVSCTPDLSGVVADLEKYRSLVCW